MEDSAVQTTEPELLQADSSYFLKRAKKYFGFSIGGNIRYMHKHVQDCKPLIEEVIRALSRINNSPIHLKKAFDPDLWNVETSAMDLQCILMEVALNALEAIPSGGRIVFKAQNVKPSQLRMEIKYKFRQQPLILIGVTDNGEGMLSNVQANIAKPYFTTREPKKRRGLGMTYVFEKMKEIGGFVKVFSFPKVGSVVNLYLPASKKKLPKLFQTREEKDKFRNASVLIVDDDIDYINMSEKILERYEYSILSASSFTEAEILFKEHGNNIDAILIDVSMNNDHIKLFLENIWEAEPHQKVIATVKPGEKYDNKFLEEYAFSDIIEKPFYFVPFIKSVNQVILNDDPMDIFSA